MSNTEKDVKKASEVKATVDVTKPDLIITSIYLDVEQAKGNWTFAKRIEKKQDIKEAGFYTDGQIVWVAVSVVLAKIYEGMHPEAKFKHWSEGYIIKIVHKEARERALERAGIVKKTVQSEKNERTVGKLKGYGMSLEQIVEATELSIETVKAILAAVKK